ncbi:MAG: PEP-CTERM domain protein [Betaproteobacteria bacterium RBG_16_58_11]|nr:MAG: PEP-CTERM domain protein [Betaproteobacteria bacterium RBG_16_58_11]
MKRKSLLMAVLLASSLAPALSAAQGVSLAGEFTDYTTWNLYGSTTVSNITPGNGFTYSTMYLTSGTGSEAGAGFAPNAIALDYNQAFAFDFHFHIPPSSGLRGDGLTFTLAGTPGVGGGGSDLGYGGLGSDSVAFAIDTFDFGGTDPVSPSVQILQGGSVTPLAYTQTSLGDSIRDPNYQWYAHVDYTPSGNSDNAGTLTGTIEHLNLGNFSVSATVDFDALGMAGNPVYYGFTAGNGMATDEHYISSAAPVPVPAAVWLLGSGLLGLIGVARRKAA